MFLARGAISRALDIPRCQPLPTRSLASLLPTVMTRNVPWGTSLPVENQGAWKASGLFPGSSTDASGWAEPTVQPRPAPESYTTPIPANGRSQNLRFQASGLTMTPAAEAIRQNCPLIASKKASIIFQSLHNSLCQGRRQCAFATHSPVHSNRRTKSPFSLGSAGPGRHLFQGNGGLWPSLIAGPGDIETGELGIGTAHIVLFSLVKEGDINQCTFLPRPARQNSCHLSWEEAH